MLPAGKPIGRWGSTCVKEDYSITVYRGPVQALWQRSSTGFCFVRGRLALRARKLCLCLEENTDLPWRIAAAPLSGLGMPLNHEHPLYQ